MEQGHSIDAEAGTRRRARKNWRHREELTSSCDRSANGSPVNFACGPAPAVRPADPGLDVGGVILPARVLGMVSTGPRIRPPPGGGARGAFMAGILRGLEFVLVAAEESMPARSGLLVLTLMRIVSPSWKETHRLA